MGSRAVIMGQPSAFMFVRGLILVFAFILLATSALIHAYAEQSSTSEDVTDSALSSEQALNCAAFPAGVCDSQCVVDVRYVGIDGRHHRGQIVVHTSLANDVREIFRELDSAAFPVHSVIPISQFGWSDDASIAVNNTSAFNYRTVAGTNRLSMHAFGRAIDLNPYLNPYLIPGRRAQRPYNPQTRGTIVRGDACYTAFTKRGWTWGGDWKNEKDYQHFEKRP
ncbi:MAG: M15 family metallopeptidase [Candidatus Kapaibacterium sp.]